MIVNSTIEETLQRVNSFIATPVGRSMLPILREGKDTVLLERISGKPQKYDMILYKRRSGQYVLHRLLEVRQNDYVMCGDNQTVKEYGITDKNIIGICTGFYRREKFIDCKGKLYLLYVRIWCSSLMLRKFFIFPMNFSSRAKGYIKRKLKLKR